MKPWLVSVILPTHDRERYLVSALDSALGQEYRPIEVIVVDDGSTDGTARVVQGYAEVRYRYQQNQGAAAARNAGVAMSGGEILAFLDSDDLWMPEKLRLQVRFLAENPAVGYCLTRMRTFVEPGTAGDPGRVDLSPPSVGAVPSTLVVRREVF
ncbi:MAG TPA: glycosyltransferase family A protein, partial [Candidatus Methylomirabilis sp.]|nr:glycosyltransferase family A protein [Candidatus Methylomirabilis sp.]